MLLAGDVGGTHTRLGLFERSDHRPRAVATRVYSTRAFESFGALLGTFAQEVPHRAIEGAAVGVAGPVVGDRAKLTNGDWDVTVSEIARHVEGGKVVLMNDLESLARSVASLADSELAVVQRGVPVPGGNHVVIAAGTGLGEAYLPRIGGRLSAVASEGGHADFSARTDRELDLVRELRARYGRAEVEQVLSGPGLENLHRFTHGTRACAGARPSDPSQMPAAISASALERRCPRCEEALRMFVEALGAEAGNLGLRGLATGGVFVGGGIAPKILPALQDGRFIQAFRDKAPMTDLLRAMPVLVIVNPDAGLVGAAIAAQQLA